MVSNGLTWFRGWQLGFEGGGFVAGSFTTGGGSFLRGFGSGSGFAGAMGGRFGVAGATVGGATLGGATLGGATLGGLGSGRGVVISGVGVAGVMTLGERSRVET